MYHAASKLYGGDWELGSLWRLLVGPANQRIAYLKILGFLFHRALIPEVARSQLFMDR